MQLGMFHCQASLLCVDIKLMDPIDPFGNLEFDDLFHCFMEISSASACFILGTVTVKGK